MGLVGDIRKIELLFALVGSQGNTTAGLFLVGTSVFRRDSTSSRDRCGWDSRC